jgi:hypothetical protein
MYIFGILCLATSLIIVLHNHRLMQREPPDHLRLAVDLVNMGSIPNELAGHIPMDYEMRETHSMSAALERTFVYHSPRPMWVVRLVLDDGVVKCDQAVLFDSNGDLYQ